MSFYTSYSASYFPSYASSYCYGYYPYSSSKYSGVSTFYGDYGYSTYPAPIVLDPLTTDRSHAYSQAEGGVEDYRAWQREEAQLAHERELDFAQDGLMVQAWDLLATGNARESLRAFTRLCEAYPAMASSKAGYSVAAALVGDERTAFWAMRRAVMAGNGMVGYLPDAQAMAPTLDRLASKLAGELEELGPSPQRSFLLAGVEMMRLDEAAALRAARDARNAGARHESLARMLAYLESQGIESGQGYKPEASDSTSLEASARTH